jgi:hypothetical protein
VDFRWEIVDQEMAAGGVAPAPIKCESEQRDVAPIDEQRGAVVDELGEQRCGKWRETDGAEEADVDPGEIAVGAGEVVELRLLPDPEDPVGHDAHQKDKQARGEREQQAAEIVLGVDGFGGGDAQVEDQQRHGDGEDAVAEGGDALHTLPCNAVVEGTHPREFSIGIGVRRKGLSDTENTGITKKGRAVRGEYSGEMRDRVAGGRERTCGVVVTACLLMVMPYLAAGAQVSEPAQNPAQAPAQNPGEAPPKELPDAPGDSKKKKDDSLDPVQEIQDKTKQAVGITKDAATAGLIKARDWESSRIAGIYVGKNRKLVTLTAEQRKEIYLKQTLTTPETYGKRMFGALIDQAEGTPRQWQGGIGGYGERWASREGQFITANTLAALGNAKLGYEVRYDRCKCDGLWPRTRHAFLRNLLTYDRSEEHLRPQWALYGGAFGGGALSTVWKPGSQNALSNGAYGMLGQLGYGTLLNFVTEFAQEINRKQGVK